jgi:hypothetical protein
MHVDKPSWSATCWWDPRLTAEISTEVAAAIPTSVPAPITEANDKLSARDYYGTVIGSASFGPPNTDITSLVVTGGCVNLCSPVKKGFWERGYRCRFFK